jgi:DNA-binding beta-propeller fold protein YncE
MRRAFLTLGLLFSAAARAEDAPAGFDLYPRGVFYQHLYEGPFTDPMGIAVDRAHREILVADTRGNRIGVFSFEGAPLFSFGGTDRMREPREVAVDAKGRILVLDADRSKIKIFSYRGDYLGAVPLEGMRESPRLEAFTLDADGNLYVGEQGSAQVWVYGPDGKVKARLGGHGAGQGTFSSIAGIAVDAEHIVVTDHLATAVQVFDRRGRFLRGFGKHDMGRENFSLPEGVAIDGKGRIIVVDALRHEIKFFDKQGTFLARFGGMGSRPGQVSFPSDVAVDPDGRVYVLEKIGARVQIFEVVPAS